MYVWNWVPVRNGASIECSVVATGSPTAVLLGHEMEGRRPQALGTLGCTVPQHGVEFGLGHGQAVWGKAAWTAGYRRAGCCPDVLCCVVTYSAMVPSWSCQPREFLQEAVWGCASCDDLHTGDLWWCTEAWHGQQSDPFEQAVVPTVNEESVV